MSFSALFLSTLVHIALGMSALGVVILLALLVRDFKDRNIW
jgi:hypothetical protein